MPLSPNHNRWLPGLTFVLCPGMTALLVIAPLPVLRAITAAFPGQENLVPLLVAVPSLAIAAGGASAGAIGNRMTKLRLLILGCLLFSLAGPAPMVLPSLPLILASRAIAGIGLGIMAASGVGLIADYYEGPQRARWLAAMTSIPSLLTVLGALVSGYLGEFGWRAPFAVLLIGIVHLLMAMLIPPRNATQKSIAATASDVGETDWHGVAWVFAFTALSPLVLHASVYEFGFALAERGDHATWLIGVVTAVSATGSMLGAVLSTRLGKLTAALRLVVTFSLSALGLCLFAAAPHIGVVLLAVLVGGMAPGLFVPTLSAWLIDSTSSAVRARTLGLYQAVLYLSLFASPLVIRFAALRLGGSLQAFRIYAVVGAVVAAAVFAMHRAMVRKPVPSPA